jgi:hypothetical protein
VGWTLSIVIAIGLCAGVAHADDRVLARDHYVKGTKAFDLGAFDEAIAEYQLAYRLRDDPALLYNLGQAHRLAGHAAEAVRFYKVYLHKVPGAANRAEVETKLVELQKLVEQQAKTRAMPPDQVRPPAETTPPIVERSATPATVTPPTAPPPSVAPVATPEPQHPVMTPLAHVRARRERQAARGEKIAGVSLLAVGVAALAAGAGCLALAKQNADALTALDRNRQPFDPGKESAGKAENAAGAALVGVGAAAALAGAIVAALGFRDARRARSLALVPLWSPRSAGAALEVRF